MAKQIPVRLYRLSRQLRRFLRAALLGLCTVLLLGLTTESRLLLAQVNPNNGSPPMGQTVENAGQWVQNGRYSYQLGQYREAVTLWQKASFAFAARGDRLNQAMVLSNLALAYQQLGQWPEANQAIGQSLQLLDSSEFSNTRDRLKVTAQALTNQGSLLLAQGQAEKALDIWNQATQLYQQLGDRTNVTNLTLNRSKALQTLGLHRQASQVLEQGNPDLQAQMASLVNGASPLALGGSQQPSGELKCSQGLEQALANAPVLNPSPGNVEGLLALGDIQQSIGNLKLSQALLESALKTDRGLRRSLFTAPILLSLGNNAQLQQHKNCALRYYQQSLAASPNPEVALQVKLNQLQVLIDLKQQSASEQSEPEQSASEQIQPEQWAEAERLIPTLQIQLSQLPTSRTAVYAQINYVRSLLRLSSSHAGDNRQNASILAHAVQQSRDLQDHRAESYALGTLGHLYEQTQQFQEAEKLTSEALRLAKLNNAAEISYRWQWQLGRMLKTRGDLEGKSHELYPQAIAFYDEAWESLKTLRKDLAATNQDVQFSFRESVEPVYRELVSLLLQTEAPERAQGNLKQARDVIESLQLAELDNFFREACLNGTPQQIEQIDPQAAVFYPVILPDRLEVIFSQPNQPLRHYSHPITPQALKDEVSQLRLALFRNNREIERLDLAKKMYERLIRPAEADLKAHGIKTLAFVLDGFLRNLPMAALYDGKQYLVENYAIALTPSLQLLKSQPLAPNQLKVLFGVLTESRLGFSALPGVEQEVKQIQAEVPANKLLLDPEFTSTAVQQQITNTPFQVVHLATHGQFGSDSENTFIVLWDKRLTVTELGEVLQTRAGRDTTPIEILVLSACKTASGDDRAVLGLAGMAVRSGARSTLATLWPVNDAATSVFMADFYQELSQGKATRAEALRQAQLAMLHRSDLFHYPQYWAPFVLVGNWL